MFHFNIMFKTRLLPPLVSAKQEDCKQRQFAAERGTLHSVTVQPAASGDGCSSSVSHIQNCGVCVRLNQLIGVGVKTNLE